VEKEWLAEQLASGRSIEAIAREVGRHPSSVAYWVHKHGLASMHAARHAPRGGIERALLAELIDEGLSIRGIAERLSLSYAAVRHCHPAALQFHHVDPSTKTFTLRDGGTRSIARMREEARKCVLLCANCHAQVEAGAADLPVRSTDDVVPPG